MKNENNCQNCKYYAQHYFWGNSHFVAAKDGYCTNTFHRYKFRTVKPENTACELWEDNKEAIQQRNQRIEDNLLYISKQLKNIALLLQAGNDKNL